MSDALPKHSDFEPPEKSLPRSEIAEQGVLGCVIQDPSGIETVSKRIAGPSAFYDIRHRTVWITLQKMANNGGIDLLTLTQKLGDAKQLEAIGGAGFLVDLTNATPSVLNLPHYLDILCEKHDLRRTIQTCEELAGHAYKDITDATSVEQYLRAAADRMASRKSRLPSITDSLALSEADLPIPLEIVQGVLHQGTKFAIGGGSKTCKTWVLLDLALSVSHGVDWLGFPVQKSPVLFLNFEIPEPFMRRRLIKLAKTKGITLQSGQLDIWNLRGYDAPFDQILPAISREIKSRGYSLIVLDPIYKMYGNLDENKAGDIARLMNSLERLTVETKASLAFAAHFSKGNQSQKESIDRISGSGVFARDPDTILTMTAHEDPNCFVLDGSLRNLPPLTPFVIKWTYPIMEKQSEADPAALKKIGGRPKAYDEEKIALLLAPASLLINDWIKLANEELGVSRASFYRALCELRQAGRVMKMVNANWTLVTKSSP